MQSSGHAHFYIHFMQKCSDYLIADMIFGCNFLLEIIRKNKVYGKIRTMMMSRSSTCLTRQKVFVRRMSRWFDADIIRGLYFAAALVRTLLGIHLTTCGGTLLL